MSGDLVRHEPSNAVEYVRPDLPKPKTDDWALVIRPIAELAEQVAGTEFVPAALRGKPAAVTAAILFGRELDMPPMQALQQVHVIEGRPSLSAEHLRAMVLAAGHILRVTGDGGQAIATGRRRLPDGSYDEPVTVEWNIRMAQAAGLTGKKNWQKHPRQMLKARATAELCRDLFPDVTHGLDAVEALQDDEDALAVAGSPSQDTKRVSRAKKGADSQKAAEPDRTPERTGPAAAPPVTAAERGSPAEPPLPGEEASPESTPGEGRATPAAQGDASTPRPVGDIRVREVTLTTGTPEQGVHPITEPRQCPNISNGQQCRYRAGHSGQHTYGGGMGDPVELRRCSIPEEHVAHAWNPERDVWYSCSGDGDLTLSDVGLLATVEEENAAHEVLSAGDGSPDDLAATATDETWAAAEEAAGGPVEENDPPMSKGAQRALFAAFGSLGVKDDQERYHTTSALLGRKVESWNDLSRREGERLFNAIGTIKTRDELEELVQRAAEEWGQGN